MCALSEDIRYMHPNCSQIACCIFFCLSLPCTTRRSLQVCGEQETSDVRSGCEQISPDPLGYGASRQIGPNLTLL